MINMYFLFVYYSCCLLVVVVVFFFFETESLFVARPIVGLAMNNWMASNSNICLSESSEC